ncbi:uncharacterized protein LOC124282580 isoform X2 [Haliotis rubra]|uniref:uncharacterized protein LOC124282580 isoform X2 n=1 Tax=Haliotis rubra TaxID=36100 RepID=UPI001EE5B864|nr:uncharacterized protein LOC124282580 isoform X2 [Haliotis rubra]
MMEKRMLVAKNLPDCAEDTLINFLEVICDNGVETIDYFDDRINHIALVTMEDEIADVSKSHAKASRRKLDGHQVDLVEVGAPVGLVVKELPEHVTEEELRSYFESSESGGRHGVVEQCKIYTTCHAATVLINESDVLQSILGKVEHDIVGNEPPATVFPFYQEFHNEVLGFLDGLQEQQGQITHD